MSCVPAFRIHPTDRPHRGELRGSRLLNAIRHSNIGTPKAAVLRLNLHSFAQLTSKICCFRGIALCALASILHSRCADRLHRVESHCLTSCKLPTLTPAHYSRQCAVGIGHHYDGPNGREDNRPLHSPVYQESRRGHPLSGPGKRGGPFRFRARVG